MKYNSFQYKIIIEPLCDIDNCYGVVYLNDDGTNNIWEFLGCSKQPLNLVNRFIKKVEQGDYSVFKYDLEILKKLLLGQLVFQIRYTRRESNIQKKLDIGYLFGAQNKILVKPLKLYRSKFRAITIENNLYVGVFAVNHYEAIFLGAFKDNVAASRVYMDEAVIFPRTFDPFFLNTTLSQKFLKTHAK